MLLHVEKVNKYIFVSNVSSAIGANWEHVIEITKIIKIN